MRGFFIGILKIYFSGDMCEIQSKQSEYSGLFALLNAALLNAALLNGFLLNSTLFNSAMFSGAVFNGSLFKSWGVVLQSNPFHPPSFELLVRRYGSAQCNHS